MTYWKIPDIKFEPWSDWKLWETYKCEKLYQSFNNILCFNIPKWNGFWETCRSTYYYEKIIMTRLGFGQGTKMGFPTIGQVWQDLQKKVREKSRECHNHKPQPFPDPKRKRKSTNLNKHKPNKRTKSTKISSLWETSDFNAGQWKWLRILW